LNITGGDKPSSIDPTNLQAQKGFKGLMTYTHSKSILEALSVYMATELVPKGITVNILFPGLASTMMTRSLTMNGLPGVMKLMFPFFRWFFREDAGKSANTAARSTVWDATTNDLDGVTGLYFDTHTNKQRLHATAYDETIQHTIIDLITSVTT
jgi:NAD(P)-dependent dehydrogenase (short-subunit alcohol dehydrogenase family)